MKEEHKCIKAIVHWHIDFGGYLVIVLAAALGIGIGWLIWG